MRENPSASRREVMSDSLGRSSFGDPLESGCDVISALPNLREAVPSALHPQFASLAGLP